MDLINQFIENYKRKMSFYEMAAKLAASQVEAALQEAGIKAIITYRVKNPGRLKAKIEQRESKRGVPYKNMKEIYGDIMDLAGVRVSLYFPGDRDKADSVICDLFDVIDRKRYPKQSEPPTYERRFSGYWANHYKVHMKEDSLDENKKKYAGAFIEVQVASLLMHAWCEVEHDLLYKPLQGTPSENELAILDELNGLVLAGEIALERLQEAGNERFRSENAQFGSQYDLASYLYRYLSTHFKDEDIELRMGNVELLFQLLTKLKLTGVKDVEPVIESIKFEKDKRNISQQIIDQIIAGNEKRYRVYEEIRAQEVQPDEETRKASEYFIRQWVPLERYLSKISNEGNPERKGTFNINTLKKMNVLDKDELKQIVALRKIRNSLIHDLEAPDAAKIMSRADDAKSLLKKLKAENAGGT